MLNIGMGTTQFWFGGSEDQLQCFETALNEYGVNIIDTAEMYGNGEAERQVGRVLKRLGRENGYLIDKILPENATPENFDKSLQRSLKLLDTDYIDLYLLHWRENADLQFVVNKMEEYCARGVIGNWGVSNFDVADLEELLACENGDKCFANEIFYNAFYRGVEYDLLDYHKEHDILTIAYSSLGTSIDRDVLARQNGVLDICRDNNLPLEAVLLSFVTRHDNMVALFSTSSVDHLHENMLAIDFDITPYMGIFNRINPAPTEKVPLEKR